MSVQATDAQPLSIETEVSLKTADHTYPISNLTEFGFQIDGDVELECGDVHEGRKWFVYSGDVNFEFSRISWY